MTWAQRIVKISWETRKMWFKSESTVSKYGLIYRYTRSSFYMWSMETMVPSISVVIGRLTLVSI